MLKIFRSKSGYVELLLGFALARPCSRYRIGNKPRVLVIFIRNSNIQDPDLAYDS